MAKAETWEKLKFFTKDENWGNTDAISDVLLMALDDFRAFVNCPVYVLSGTTGVHSKQSYHYEERGACAVDLALPEYSKSAFDLVLDASRFGFTGIGYYPHWQWKGIPANGLHLDMRPLRWDKDDTLNYRHSRWMGIRSEGKQIYIDLSYENIQKYGVKNG